MSRIKRISYAITPEGHRANAIKQAIDLRDKVLSIVDDSNFSTSTARKITKKAAFSVVMRSLEASKGLPLSLREHLAMKELNNYIALAKHNKSDFFYASNTDLLPISHPRSTREHSMTASALRISRSRWFAADPRITDERAKAVLASAFESVPGSVEHLYYTSILLSLPQGTVPGDALIAATDGNSSESRSARARRQRRDRKGRFAYEGGGIRALIRRANGEIFSISGRVVANAKNSRDVEVEFPDGKIAQINPAKGEYIKAVLPTPDGYSPKPIVPSVSEEVIDEKDLVFLDAPNGWVKDEAFKDFGDKVERYVDSNKEFVVFASKKDDGTKDYQILNASSAEEIDVVNTWAEVQDRLEGKEDQILNQKAGLPKQQVAPVENKGGFEYNYPDNAYKIKQDSEYDVQGRVDEESPDFTDDPVELAQRQDERDLLAALEQAVSPGEDGENALGVGALPFGKGDEFVPAEAIFFALQEAGMDAPMELAKIYDKKLGNNSNEKALNDFRKKAEVVSGNTPELAESFKKVTEQNPDLELPTEEPKFDAKEAESAPLPALLEGLSQKELEQFMETKDHIPYLPKNEEIEMPEGYNPLSPEPFAAWKEVTAENPDPVLPEGFSDNPVYLAQEIPTNDLLKELRRSVEPGNEVPGAAVITLPTEDGEDFVANVPGEAVRDALQLKGVDTNAELKKIADEGFVGQREEPIAELPLDEPAEKKPMNAYERLMAEQKAEAEAVQERVAKLKKDAEDRIDEQGRSVPEGWGFIAKNKPNFGQVDRPDNYFNVYGNNNFEASIDANGKITVKDRNGLIPDKSYDNWEDLQADLANQKSEYSSAARERVREIAKKYGYSDEQIAAFDSMSQQELADFFANPENHTPAYAEALDDLANSSAIDLPNAAQKQRWAEMRANEKILAQAGDAPSEKAPEAEKPVDGLPLTGEILNGKVKYSIGDKKQTNDVTYRILNLKGDTSSLTEKINKLKSRNFIVTGEDGGDLQIQVQRDKKRFPAPGNVKEDIDDILKQLDAPSKNAPIDDEALLDRRLAGESLDVVAEDLGIPREEVRRREMDALRKRREANPELPPPSEEPKSKELSEGDKAVIKNNAFVEESAGTLQPTEARNLKVGDFMWNAFFGRYEEILAMETADMGRIKFTVFNVYNNKEEVRYFEMDSPLRNVRRPGIEDQAEPIPSAKGAPRGGKRKEIKRKPLGERIVGKEGRKVGGNVDAEGFYKDENGVPLKPGDVVVYHEEKNEKAKVWKRGVIKALVGAQVTEGEKAGGMVRKGVLYLDNLIVQWEGEDAEWAIKQGGREMKAKNLIRQEGEIGDIPLPDFRGGRAVPNAGRLVAPDAVADDKFAVPLMEPIVRKDKDKDLEEQIRRAIDAGDEVSFNYNGKTRYVKPIKIWNNPINDNINVTAIENGEIKNFTISKMGYIEDPEGAALKRPAPAPEAPKAAPEMPEDIVKKTVKDLNGGQFELSLIKIGDVYEGAVINKQNGNVQIVVRDKNEQNARVDLARAGDYIQQAAAGDEAMNDGVIPNLDKVNETPAPKSSPPALMEKPEKPKPKQDAPRRVFNGNVFDKNDREFYLTIIFNQINNEFEANAFPAGQEKGQVIAKSKMLGDVQAVLNRFIEDVVNAEDGNKVLRSYAGIPEPEVQPVLTRDTDVVPELPEKQTFDLKSAKARAREIKAALLDKEFLDVPTPEGWDVVRVKENLEFRKKRLAEHIGPDDVDRRQGARFAADMKRAASYAKGLGWFEEAKQLEALAGLQKEIPLRKMDAEFDAKVAELEKLFPEMYALNKDIEVKLGWMGDERRQVLRKQFDNAIIYPDAFNPIFRNAVIGIQPNIDELIQIAKAKLPDNEAAPIIERLQKVKAGFQAFGDLPKLPLPQIGSDEANQYVAKVAREFEGIGNDAFFDANGRFRLNRGDIVWGDWKFKSNISAGINKLLVLENSITKEVIIIKYDNDKYNNNPVFKGNGIKAEEMVNI
jgi:hypothetical protein